jgi:3',5'-cyclic AMP phosphodiesterase CpdA
VAGDVSDDLATFRRTLELLAAAYGEIFFVPGNHEM